MERRWRAFDTRTINAELRAIPDEDRRRLKYAMENYALDSGAHYRVESYDDFNLMMVTDRGRGQGRCLFFAVRSTAQHETLIALLVYKKEGRKADPTALRTARQRMRNLEEG